MEETSYYPEMTVGLLKRLLKDIPDDVIVNIMNNEGKDTANIELLYIKGERFNDSLNLIGLKPFYEMTEEERERHKR